MINFGAVPAGSVLPIFFSTYGKTNGESITLTGLAVTDIEVYKGASVTQRASDSGYTLIDTDGIDVDGVTGIHGFSIDTGDNDDSGFYSVGSFFTVVVSSVTIDSQTVNFIAATFRLVAAEASAGVPKVDVSHNAGSAITAASGIQEVKVASIANDAITASSIAANAIGAAEIADGAIDAATFAAGAINAAAIASDAITDAKVASDVTIASVTGSVGSVAGNVDGSIGSLSTQAKADVNAEADAALADVGVTTTVTGRIDAAVSTRASQTSVDTVDDLLDTEIAAIKAKTDNLPSDPADASDISDAFSTVNSTLATIATYIDTEVGAIKTKTDQLTFGVANTLNANVTHVNEVEVAGDGDATAWGPA